MSKKAVDLTISTVPAKKVASDLAKQEKLRQQRLEQQRAEKERQEQERQRQEQERQRLAREKALANSKVSAVDNMWNRGSQQQKSQIVQRETAEGYQYEYKPWAPKPTVELGGRRTGNVTSVNPSTTQQRREADLIGIREYYNSQEDAPAKGSPRALWNSLTWQEKSLAERIGSGDWDETDAEAVAFIKKMSQQAADGNGENLIREAWRTELDSTGRKAQDVLDYQYDLDDSGKPRPWMVNSDWWKLIDDISVEPEEKAPVWMTDPEIQGMVESAWNRNESAAVDASVTEENKALLAEFSDAELEILFSSIGRGGISDDYGTNAAYAELGVSVWNPWEMQKKQDELVERAGGKDAVRKLWETYDREKNAQLSDSMEQYGRDLSAWSGTAGFLGARLANLYSTLGSIGEAAANSIPFFSGRTGQYSTADPNSGNAAIRSFASGADQYNVSALESLAGENKVAEFILKNGYNAFGQAGDNIIRNLSLGPFGLAFMGTDSFNRSWDDAAEAGIDPGRALAVSFIKGAEEIGTEMIPFDTAMKSLSGKSTVGDLLIGFFGEVAGEELSELIGDVADEVILGNDAERIQKIYDLCNSGVYNYEEAESIVNGEYGRKYLDILVETIISSGITEGVEYAAGKVMNKERQDGTGAENTDAGASSVQEHTENTREQKVGAEPQAAAKPEEQALDSDDGWDAAVRAYTSNDDKNAEDLPFTMKEETNDSEIPNGSAESTEDAAVAENAAVSDGAADDAVEGRTTQDANVQEDGKDARYSGKDAQESAESAQSTSDADVIQAGMDGLKLSSKVARPVIENGFRLARGITAEDYMLGVREAYRFGQNGMRADLGKGEFSGKLHPVIQNAAYNAGKIAGGEQIAVETAQIRNQVLPGKQDAGIVHYAGDRGKLSELQQTSLKALDKVSKVLGKDFYLYESTAEDRAQGMPNGWYDPSDRSIHIDINAGMDGRGTILFTAAHELTHYAKDQSPAKYKRLTNFLLESYGQKGVSVDELVQQKADAMRGQKQYQNMGAEKLYDAALEEVTADSMESMLADGNLGQKLAELKKADRSTWQMVKDWFAQFAEKIREAYKGLAPNSEEGRMVARMKDSLDQIQQLFAEALDDASRNEQKAKERGAKQAEKNTTREGSVKYNLRSMNISRTFIDYGNVQEELSAIDATVSDLMNRGKYVDVPITEVQAHRNAVNWSYVKAARAYIKDILRPFIGSAELVYHNGQSTEVYLTKDGFNHTAAGINTAEKASVLARFKEIIANAEYSYSSKNDPHSKMNQAIGGQIDWDCFVTAVKIGEFSYPVVLKFRTIDRDARSQLYRMATKKEIGSTHDHGQQKTPLGNLPDYGTKPISSNESVTQGESESQAKNGETKKFSMRNPDSEKALVVDSEVQKNTTPGDGVKYHSRYSYNELIQKDPMHITEIDESDQNVNTVSKMSRNDVKKQAKNNARQFGTVDASGTLKIHVDDNGKDVVIGTKGIEHGLRRTYSRNWLVTLNAGEIIKNSVQINELIPEDPKAKASYVLIGAARNQNGEMYIVRTVVDTYSSELNYIEVFEQDVLHAIANKSEEQRNKGQLGNLPSGASANNAFPITGPDISIATLLDYVNEFYPELLPEDVLKHYGYSSRPHGEMSNDVLYQQRGNSGRELKAAQKENAKLKEELADVKELLKLQGQVTGGRIMTKSSIAEEAKILMKRYNVSGDAKELAGMLDAVYRYIASGEELTMEGVYEAASPAAEWMLEHTKQDLDSYAKEVLDQMKGNRIKLDATQLQEAASLFGSMRDFRKALGGAVTVGEEGEISLDSWWQSMAAAYPDLFDAEMNAADMPGALAAAVDTLHGMKTDITDEFGEEAVRQGILQDVYDGYWDVSTLHTVADRYQRRINELKGTHRARMDELKQERAQTVDQLKAEKRQALLDVRQKYREDMHKQMQELEIQYRENHGVSHKAGDSLEGSDIELKKDFSDYPYNQQKVIEGYEEAVDEDILEFIERHDRGETWKGQKIQIGSVSDRMAADIEKEAGVSGKAGSKIYFSTNALEHIQNRHGGNGEHDSTMSNPQDIARINFVLENYDGCKRGRNAGEFKNKDGSRAATIVFWKKINGTYFVAEAVPDGAKTWIVSAYMDKKGAAQTFGAENTNPNSTSKTASKSAPSGSVQVPDASNDAPSLNVQNEPAYASTTSIDAQNGNVNAEKPGNFDNSGTDNGTSVGAASAGFTNDAEYNALGRKYGTQPARASDAVPTNVPNADRDGRKVSKFASNLYGSKIMKDSTLPFLRELVKNGSFSYDPETNEQTYSKALDKLVDKTWDQAIKSIREFAISGKTSAEAVMQAEVMMEYFMQMQNEDGEIGSEARRQLAEIASVSKMLSVNSGRVLQAFKSFRQMHPAAAAMMFKNDMHNTFERLAQGQGFKVKNGGDITISDDLQNAYLEAFNELRNANTDENREKARRKITDIQDAAAVEMAGQLKASAATKLRAWRYMAMLGNFKTQGRNIFGNAGMVPLREVSRAMQGALQKAVIQNAGNRTVANVGFSEADRELLAWAKKDTKNQDIKDAFAYTGKLGADAAVQKYSALLRTFDLPALEWVRTTTNAAVKGGDILFKNREYVHAMAAWLKAKKITVQQLQNGEVSSEKLNEGRSYAIQQALIATFNDASSFSDALANMKFKNPDNIVKKAINIFGEAIIPFRATPANVAVRAVEYSPIGLINGIGQLVSDIRSGKGTNAQTVAKICDGMTGTALFAFGMLLANGFCGVKLHGPGVPPEDEKDGVQPWSVELPGGYIYDISWLAPANMPLFMGVQVANELEGQGVFTDGRTIWDVLNAGGELLEPILSLSCMSSLSDLLDSMAYASNEDRIWTLATQGATSYLGQFIPTLVRQIYNGSKEFKQSTYTNTSNTLERKALQFAGGIPWIGDALGLRMEKLDEYGQPIKTNQAGSNDLWARELNSLIGLGKLTKREHDPLRAETKRLREDGFGKVTIALPEKIGASITQSGEWDSSKRYAMDEWIAMAKTQGAENQKIRDYIQSKEYQTMSDSEKLAALKKLDDRAGDTAREEHLWNAVLELNGVARKSALDTLTGKNGEYKVMSQAMQKGVTFRDFREIASGYGDRADNKTASKMYGVIGSGASGKAVEALLPSYMTESQQKKWEGLKAKGASSRDFVRAYEQVADDKNGKPGSTGLSKSEEEKRVAYFRAKTYITSSGKTAHYSESAALKLIHLMQAGFTEEQAIDYYHILK